MLKEIKWLPLGTGILFRLIHQVINLPCNSALEQKEKKFW